MTDPASPFDEQSSARRTIDGPLRLITVPQAVLNKTRQFMAGRGEHSAEAVVLWLGWIDGSRHGRVLTSLIPAQVAYVSDDGVAVQVPDDEIAEILRMLPAGILILARVHSHPAAAYHSSTDDLNRLLSHVGAISIVVPHFASLPIEFKHCSINELGDDHIWRELKTDEVERRFKVEPSPAHDADKSPDLDQDD